MNTKTIYLTLLIFVLILTGCATPVEPPRLTEAVTQIVAEPTSSPTVAIQTTTSTPTVIPGFSATILKLEMIDSDQGTALFLDENGEQILAMTQNNGANWVSITPKDVTNIPSFDQIDAETIIMVSNNTDGSGTLWKTVDGGVNWTKKELFTEMLGAQIDFSPDGYGLALAQDAGAGHRYLHYYESTDFGENWSLIPLLPPAPEDGLPEGVIQLCGICGDWMEQTESISLIIYGEMANEPKEFIQLTTSADRGVSWKTIELQKPDALKTHLVMPLAATVSDGSWSAFVALISPESIIDGELLALNSTDGGITWTLKDLSIEVATPQNNPIEFFEPHFAAMLCGTEICFIDTLSNSVERVPYNFETISNDFTGIFDVHIKFIDRQTGWLILTSPKGTYLYQTVDGGISWVWRPLSLNEADPS